MLYVSLKCVTHEESNPIAIDVPTETFNTEKHQLFENYGRAHLS